MKKLLRSVVFVLSLFFFVSLTHGVRASSTDEKILHFSSASCDACVNQPELVQEIANEHGIKVVLLTAEDNKDLMQKYGVNSIPSLVLLRDDQVLGKLNGRITTDQLEKFIENSESVIPSDKQQTDNNLTSNNSNDSEISNTTNGSKIHSPLIVATAALVLATTAISTIVIVKKRHKTGSASDSNNLVISPADGTMVSKRQAQHEQALLDQGFVYNPTRDGFDYKSKQEKQNKVSDSILSKEIKIMRAQNKGKKGFLDNEIKKIHQERIDNIRGDIKFERKQYKRFIKRAETMDKFSKGAQLVEDAADIGIDALSEVTGPAGKSIKKTYEIAKNAVTVADRTATEGVDGFVSATNEVLKDRARGKVLDKINIHKCKSKNKAIRYFKNKVVNDSVDSALKENIQKPLEKKLSESTRKAKKHN